MPNVGGTSEDLRSAVLALLTNAIALTDDQVLFADTDMTTAVKSALDTCVTSVTNA